MASFFAARSTQAEKPALLTPGTSRRKRTSNPIFAILTLLSLAAVSLYLYRNNGFSFYRKPAMSPFWNDNSEWPIPEIPGPDLPAPDEPFEPLKRYSLDYGKVACWQKNGVWIKELTPVEMASLGVDRFQDTERAATQADEDTFCAHLRAYGASFWELPPQWPEHVNWCAAIDDCVEPTKKVSLELGFPVTGGVWMLDTSQGWEGLYPRSLGLRNALTMDERCRVIGDLGGHFCEDIQACPQMAALLGP